VNAVHRREGLDPWPRDADPDLSDAELRDPPGVLVAGVEFSVLICWKLIPK
jgi:hypothetical protein